MYGVTAYGQIRLPFVNDSYGEALLEGSSSITATADPGGTSSITAASSLTASAVATPASSASLRGSSSITVTGYGTIFSAGSFMGEAGITVDVQLERFADAHIDGASAVIAEAEQIFAAAPKLEGSSKLTIGEPVITYATIQKEVMYKVFKAGQYLRTWNPETEVTSSPTIKEQINSAGSEVKVTLARKADDFGEEADVDYGNIVQVIVADRDAPNGVSMFFGSITKYHPMYGNEQVEVTLLGLGYQLSNYIIEETDGSTEVVRNSYEVSDILRDIIDGLNTRGCPVTYTVDSIDDTGNTVSYTFNTNTGLEGVDKCLEMAPQDWYYYIDQTVNPAVLHFHQKVDTPDHVFSVGKDVADLDIEKSIETVANVVYFRGKDTLYIKRTLPTSIAEYGEKAIKAKDERVSILGTAEILVDRLLVGNPQILVGLDIADNGIERVKGYDIESVKIGQMVKLTNTGDSASSAYDSATYDTSPYDYDLSNIGTIKFQLTERTYTLEGISTKLSTTAPDVYKRIADIKRNIEDAAYSTNPSAPS